LLCAAGPPEAGAALASATTTSTTQVTLATVVIPAIGPGYGVTSEGPLNPSTFASNAPDPAAALGALGTLGTKVSTYQRVWADGGQTNEVQDLLVRFPTAATASIYRQAVDHALASGHIVSSAPVPSIPGARRTTYFAATNTEGVGQAITMQAGEYVDLLSFFSASAGNTAPISQADATTVAHAQWQAMLAAPGGASGETDGGGGGATTWIVAVCVVGLLVVVALFVVWRRRRSRPVARS
jgi:hypothetical protein